MSANDIAVVADGDAHKCIVGKDVCSFKLSSFVQVSFGPISSISDFLFVAAGVKSTEDMKLFSKLTGTQNRWNTLEHSYFNPSCLV